jgi:hypothetical protein
MSGEQAAPEPQRTSVKPEENLPLSEILKLRVDPARVERLKRLTTVDAPDVTDEVFTWLIRQQAEWVNIQYTRFLAGATVTAAPIRWSGCCSRMTSGWTTPRPACGRW